VDSNAHYSAYPRGRQLSSTCDGEADVSASGAPPKSVLPARSGPSAKSLGALERIGYNPPIL
jgi:hypothetical protein